MDSYVTRYVEIGGSQVAYQVTGDGSADLVWSYGLGGQVDLIRQLPSHDDFMRRLEAFRRVIVFDRRGSGASDPVPLNAIPTWEVFAEDLTGVLDATDSKSAAVIGTDETGPISILFAAMHPERVSHLVLINTTARYLEADDYDIGVSPAVADSVVELFRTRWGSEDLVRMVIPPQADAVEVTGWAQMMRASATPASAAAQMDYVLHNLDVRAFLPLVQPPTLIIHAADAPFPSVEHARYLAARIPDATLIEYPGSSLVLGPEPGAADVVEFLTGERHVEIDRVLATVLFTDIVGSTQRAASMGDQRWHSLLDAHDRALREQIRRFKGRELKTIGDGFVVSFDGPARAIRCAIAINDAMRSLGIDLRVGLHTGECEVRGDDLGGLAVHIAARIGALADAREILVSGALKDLVIGSGIEFTERGDFDLKGVPGSWRLFTVAG